jgi:hypothetical protein
MVFLHSHNRARGQEYKFTTKWGDNTAECKVQAHCGAGFTPDTEAEQAPYFPDGYFETNPLCVNNGGGTEGIGSTNADIPWAIKVARTQCNFIAAEGITGHPGPFFSRKVAAVSVWIVKGKNAAVRLKWL